MNNIIDIGMTLPARGPLTGPECIVPMAEHAEHLGFTILAVPDHIVVPRAIDSRYPYSASGEFPGATGGDCLDQFTTLAFVAALTTKAKLLTSVTVIPHRGAVHTAKIVSTLDVLSGGRVILGVGAGWMKEEFEALGAPPFEARGKVTDEWLESFKVLWTESAPRYHGEHVSFDNISFLPHPVQKPHPPIWVGGESGPALRRTVRYGDAWYPIGTNPRHLLNTPSRLRGGLENLQRAAQRQSRDPSEIMLTFFSNSFREGTSVAMHEGEREFFTGSDDDVAGDIHQLRELGFRHLILNFQREDLDRTLASMTHFVENIRSKI